MGIFSFLQRKKKVPDSNAFWEKKDIDQIHESKMTDDVENISQHQLMENTGQIFHVFEELPLAYAVYKVVQESEGSDAILLYANKMFVSMTNRPLENLIGNRASSLVDLDANSWLKMAEQAGLDGKRVTGKFYDGYLNCEFEITAYPVIGPGFCAFTFQEKRE